ncbi:MAG: PAS domain-containing protein [Chlorobiaceae bacterium]|nr:PAS domain-containing protein [Chlorobiaceae bacterium]
MLTNDINSSEGDVEGDELAIPGSFSCPAFIIDPSGTILDANSAFSALFQIPSIKVIGLDVYGLQAFGRHITAVASGLREKVEEVVSTGNKVSFEDVQQGRTFRHTIEPERSAEGEICRLLVIVKEKTGDQPVEGADTQDNSCRRFTPEESSNILAMMMDIARRKLVDDQTGRQQESLLRLEQAAADRALGRLLEVEQLRTFLGMVFQEYCTLQAVIHGNAEPGGLKLKYGEAANRHELNSGSHDFGRFVEFMENAMQQRQAVEGRQSESTGSFRIAPVIAYQADAFRALWPDRTFICSTQLDESVISGDSSLINVAVFNLLDNARKYSPPHSTIEMESLQEGEHVVIRIRNHTSAITQEEADTFFVKFRRGSNSCNTPGAGLGLWLVRDILNRHNGSVRLEVTDSGVEVTVRIPVESHSG